MKVDTVITWVNSDDANWTTLKYKHYKLNENDMIYSDVQRFIANGYTEIELNLCVTSILTHMSWINDIFIIVHDGQLPSIQNDKIKIINHSVIFDKLNDLPTFNSHAIEANIH